MPHTPQHLTVSRRRFLGQSAAALIGLHAAVGRAEGETTSACEEGLRLLSLELACAAPLDAMATFYGRDLGLEVLRAEPDRLTIAGGRTRITFVADRWTEPPFYHFAFNIPEHKILAARNWQRRRTPLIPGYETLRDPELPDDIVDYRNWNAHSIFFWDPAGNCVEYIARHDLPADESWGPADAFGPDDILYASEIAFIVDDVASFAGRVESTFGLMQYRRASDVFHASGDERGLVLTMRRGRNLGFAEGKPADVYATAATLRAPSPATLRAEAFPYHLAAS
ncbi:MAG: hypothetical protein AAGC60_03550 [Acidobacteriota bacterium]